MATVFLPLGITLLFSYKAYQEYITEKQALQRLKETEECLEVMPYQFACKEIKFLPSDSNIDELQEPIAPGVSRLNCFIKGQAFSIDPMIGRVNPSKYIATNYKAYDINIDVEELQQEQEQKGNIDTTSLERKSLKHSIARTVNSFRIIDESNFSCDINLPLKDNTKFIIGGMKLISNKRTEKLAKGILSSYLFLNNLYNYENFQTTIKVAVKEEEFGILLESNICVFGKIAFDRNTGSLTMINGPLLIGESKAQIMNWLKEQSNVNSKVKWFYGLSAIGLGIISLLIYKKLFVKFIPWCKCQDDENEDDDSSKIIKLKTI